MKKSYLRFLLLLSIGANSVFSYTGNNDPSYIVPNGTHYLNDLPLNSELSSETTPWANSFWPSVYGSIAFRWNDYYQNVDDLSSLHEKVDGVDKEIGELEKLLFVSKTNDRRSLQLTLHHSKDELSVLKGVRKNLIHAKAKKYKKYFFDIKRPRSISEVKRMSESEINSLSPAEKYDLYRSLLKRKNSFKLTNYVLKKSGPNRPYWEGICHGWSSASIEFKEPKIRRINIDGVKFSFYSSDLKALLSYYHAQVTANSQAKKKRSTRRVGNRCRTKFSENSWFIKNGVEYFRKFVDGEIKTFKLNDACVDTNPGAFHIVLGNRLGIQKKSFVAEMVRNEEVWNQPVYKYDSKVTPLKTPYIRKSRGTVTQVLVHTELFYANDGGRMFWRHDGSDDEFYAWKDKTNGTPNYRFSSKKLKYILDLDAYGRILGGSWLSYERPDFLWIKKGQSLVGRGARYGIVNYMDELKNLVELR